MAVDSNTVGMTPSDGQFTSAMAVDSNTVGMTAIDGQFTSAMAVFTRSAKPICAPHRLSEADLKLDAPLCGSWLSR